MYARQEVANMSDTDLLVAFDGCAGRIRAAWMRGESGRYSDAMLLGLLTIEAGIRQLPLRPLQQFDQLTLPLGDDAA